MHVIKVKSKEIKDGKKAFTVYKALFGKLWVDVKLTKKAKPIYKKDEDGEYICDNEENINISVNENGFPVIWIK